MDIFGKKEDKAAPYQGFGTQYANGAGTIMDGQQIARNNQTYWRMYRINTDIRAAIRELCETSAKSGYKFQFRQANGKKKDVDVEGFVFAMQQSGGFKSVKSEIIRHVGIFGNAYLVTAEKNVRNQPIRFEVWDPRHVSIVTDSDLVPLRYVYQPPNMARQKVAEAEDVLHVTDDTDLDSPVFGISKLETLVLDVMGDEEASLSNYHFFGNDSIPSALFVLREGLNADQVKATFQVIKDTLQGGHNKHKNIVSTAIQDVKPIRQDHKDMGFGEQRAHTSERICVAYGVPRTVLGYIEDANRSNGETQYEKFIENTIRPLERSLEEIFTQVAKKFEPRAEFVVVDEHIDDVKERSQLARDNVAGGIWTRNEAREYLGRERVANEYADEITVPTSQQLLDNLGNGGAMQPVPVSAS